MIYLIGINIISFVLYGIDKGKAILKRERIPERILLILSLIGGCYGALLGMILFRHKIRKKKFIITALVSIILWTTIMIIGGIL